MVCMLHRLGFDKENVYEELRAAVRYVSDESILEGWTHIFFNADLHRNSVSTGS